MTDAIARPRLDPAIRSLLHAKGRFVPSQTEWPAYAYAAPMSWLVRRDMEAGREKLNFPTWVRDGNEAGDAAETIVLGTTPPGRYLLLHSEARLSQDEQLRLVQGLEVMEEGHHDRRGRGCGRG